MISRARELPFNCARFRPASGRWQNAPLRAGNKRRVCDIRGEKRSMSVGRPCVEASVHCPASRTTGQVPNCTYIGEQTVRERFGLVISVPVRSVFEELRCCLTTLFLFQKMVKFSHALRGEFLNESSGPNVSLQTRRAEEESPLLSLKSTAFLAGLDCAAPAGRSGCGVHCWVCDLELERRTQVHLHHPREKPVCLSASYNCRTRRDAT